VQRSATYRLPVDPLRQVRDHREADLVGELLTLVFADTVGTHRDSVPEQATAVVAVEDQGRV
jgi:hypothetical protein